MSKPIRDQGGHLGLLIGPENIDLVEDLNALLPVKFIDLHSAGQERNSQQVKGASKCKKPR